MNVMEGILDQVRVSQNGLSQTAAQLKASANVDSTQKQMNDILSIIEDVQIVAADIKEIILSKIESDSLATNTSDPNVHRANAGTPTDGFTSELNDFTVQPDDEPVRSLIIETIETSQSNGLNKSILDFETTSSESGSFQDQAGLSNNKIIPPKRRLVLQKIVSPQNEEFRNATFEQEEESIRTSSQPSLLQKLTDDSRNEPASNEIDAMHIPAEALLVNQRPKRMRKINPDVAAFLKRRYSTDFDHESDVDGAKLANAMKKRHSKQRKTVCFDQSSFEVGDSDSANQHTLNDEEESPDEITFRHNTDNNVHSDNPLYTRLCIFCNVSAKNLVKHYVINHPNNEVPISRLPPQEAKQLDLQTNKFQIRNGLIKGNCAFCGLVKCCEKKRWQLHYLTHTGEKLFSCDGCHTDLDKQNLHSSECSDKPCNIFRKNCVNSIVGFMCKDCNYLQIAERKMVKHLTKEHGYKYTQESHQYKRVTLISIPRKNANNAKAQ